MSSASDSNPWVIPRPGHKPPPGPERSTWLDMNLLYRHRDGLYDILDRISPALRQNQSTLLEHESVAIAILQFLEEVNASTAGAATLVVLLRYFQQGFRQYCRQHRLKSVRIPLVEELGLEDGLLDGDVLNAATRHQAIVDCWIARTTRMIDSKATPTGREIVETIGMSAALFGGLALPWQWEHLIEALARPIQTARQFIGFDFRRNDRFHRWIADPVTEALIRRFTHLGHLPLSTDVDGPEHFKKYIADYLPPAGQSKRCSSSDAMRQLEFAVKGALIRFFAPVVASIALGQLATTALPELAWRRLMTGPVPKREEAPGISVQPTLHTNQHKELSDPVAWRYIRTLKEKLAWNPEEKRKAGLEDSSESPQVRIKYISSIKVESAGLRRDILQHYRNQGLDGQASYAMALCHFTDDLIGSGGPRKESLAPATISSYFGSIWERLPALAVADLREVSVETRQEAYLNAIMLTSDCSRGGVEVAIQLFERTLCSHFDLDESVDWSQLPLTSRHVSQDVDANLVDAASYKILWTTLEQLVCNLEEYRVLWQALALLLYRFGLRRGEAHEITLADIQFAPDRQLRLHIPPSRLTTRKSRSSIREIGPVTLPEAEWCVMEKLVALRKKEATYRNALRDVYLFARPGHGSQLLDAKTLFDPITKLLHWITGDTSLRIHHFRHGLASRLFAAGRSPLPEIDELLHRHGPWLECFRQDGAWVRAFELGHISPMESITTYCHTAELVQYNYSCQLVSETMTHRTLSALAGLSDRSLERAMHRQRVGNLETLDAAIELALGSIRQRWPLQGDAPPAAARHAVATRSIRLEVTTGQENTVSKKVQFEDVLKIVRERLCNQLNITPWEQKGISSWQIRAWMTRIDKLVSLGFLRANRRRRDRMSKELIGYGETALRILSDNVVSGAPELLARCLVGCGRSSEAIQIDTASANKLKTWLEFQNAALGIALEGVASGFSEITFKGKSPITRSDEKMFIVVLAVLLLSEEELDRLVSPYRRL